jgi:hypothetical protein
MINSKNEDVEFIIIDKVTNEEKNRRTFRNKNNKS